MFTDSDMSAQIYASLDGRASDFDLAALIDELQAEYGTCPIDDIPAERYWEIVAKHDVSE